MKKNIKTHVVYATTNKKKIKEVGKHFDPHGISLASLQDFLPVNLEIEDTGEALGENAICTSYAYARELSECVKPGTQFLVISEDTEKIVLRTIIAIVHVDQYGLISEPHVFEGSGTKDDKKVNKDHQTQAYERALPFIKMYL